MNGLACQLARSVPEFDHYAPGIRLRPDYRNATCKAWRKLTADNVRAMRRTGKISIPHYNEAKAEYENRN